MVKVPHVRRAIHSWFQRGAGLTCAVLLMGCRVRSTQTSPEVDMLKGATGVSATVPQLPRPAADEEEEFWPSLALRPVKPPHSSRPAPTRTAVEMPSPPGPESAWLSAPLPETPAVLLVVGLNGEQVTFRTDLDAVASELSTILQSGGRAGLLRTLQVWQQGSPSQARSRAIALRSSLGTTVELPAAGDDAALNRAFAVLWGGSVPTVPALDAPPELPMTPSVRHLSLLVSMVRPADEGAKADAVVPPPEGVDPPLVSSTVTSEREYVSISSWQRSEDAPVGLRPVWQVTGAHGAVVALSVAADAHAQAGARAAYAALAHESVRVAAEQGLKAMAGGGPESARAVAVLRSDEAWVASARGLTRVGMSPRLRQHAAATPSQKGLQEGPGFRTEATRQRSGAPLRASDDGDAASRRGAAAPDSTTRQASSPTEPSATPTPVTPPSPTGSSAIPSAASTAELPAASTIASTSTTAATSGGRRMPEQPAIARRPDAGQP